MSWLSRFRNALNPRRLDEDLAEELADHLERRAADMRAKGLDAGEARRRAQLRFGNATLLREKSRGIRLSAALEGTMQDVRYAWRGMGKAPVFTVTAVFSLALAIGANTAIYSILDAAVLRPLPVSQPDRLFTLSYPDISQPGSPAGPDRNSFSYPELQQYGTAVRPAARLALFSYPLRIEARIPHPNSPIEKLTRAYTSGEGFDLLGVRPVLGRLFSPEQDRIPLTRRVAVLSYEFWQRRFQADPGVIGRAIIIDGKAFEVTGVAQKGFFGVEPGKFVDVWLPGTAYEQQALTQIGWHWFQIIGRFAPGSSARQVEAHIQPSFHDFQLQRIKEMPTMPEAIRKQFLESKIHARSAAAGVSDFRKTFSRPLWIIFGVASGILLIACANVASLLLARAAARSTEMAMRISLGAARLRLVRQMLTESLVLSFLAGALGWLIARVVGPFLVNVLSSEANPVQFVLAIDTRVLLFCIGVSTVSAVLFGLVPAWQASGVSPARALHASAGQAAKLRLGKLFVSIQVACAFCLVTVGAAFLFSLGNLLRVNPGFDSRNVAVLSLVRDSQESGDPVEWEAKHPEEVIRARNAMFEFQNLVASQPGIQKAALAWWPIFEGTGWSQQICIPGHQPSEQEEILYRVSPGYFAALRTPLLAGRDFVTADASAKNPAPAIVNEAFARRYFNSTNILGREFSYMQPPSPAREVIVGIAADANYGDLRKPADPIVYLPLEGSSFFCMYIRSALPLGQLVPLVNRHARSVDPTMRITEVATLQTLVGNTLLREKLLAGVGGTFAFFGLVLAAVGLFGLLNYSVGRRTKEIGIRAALGARRPEIVSLVLRDVIGLTGGGLIAGLGGALMILAVFRSLLFGIRTADPFVAATAIGFFLFTAFIAASFPAHRAATLDPMIALREE